MTLSHNKFTVIACLATMLFMSSCSENIHSYSWKSKEADFSNYKSYAWLAPGDSALNSRRDDKLFAGTIEMHANAELKKKGMSINASKPDAVFMYDTQLEDHISYTTSPTLSVGVGFAGPGYYVGGMAPVAGGEVTAHESQEGMIIFEMYDLQTGKLIWKGWASRSLKNSTDIQLIIKNALHYIFATLPVKNKK